MKKQLLALALTAMLIGCTNNSSNNGQKEVTDAEFVYATKNRCLLPMAETAIMKRNKKVECKNFEKLGLTPEDENTTFTYQLTFDRQGNYTSDPSYVGNFGPVLMCTEEARNYMDPYNFTFYLNPMRIVITRTEITTNNDGLYVTSLSITDFTFNKESWSSKLIYTVNTKYVDPNIKETAEYKLVETYNYSYTYYE